MKKEKQLDIDKELEAIMRNSSAKICIVGAGGAGNNTISRLNEIGIDKVETITANTDAQDLYYSKAHDKILIGKKLCRGLGAGGNSSVGENAVIESGDDIKKKLKDADMVFITCGLGGGTGTGAVPVISRIAKETGALSIAIVTMPFTAEGPHRYANAERGLAKLKDNVDTVIVIPNDKLLEVAPNMPLNKAFLTLDEILSRAVKGITELITKPGLVSLDFADIKSIMKGSGMAMIGMGESSSSDRAFESVYEAVNSPLLNLDISDATGALINISGSSDLTLQEAEKVVQIVADKLNPEANIIFGVQIDDSLQNTIRTTIIVSGACPYNEDLTIEKPRFKEEPEVEQDLDLDSFVDGVF
jgi:cell division protein FtsZ